jgi:Tfp pilus assembly protein PilV
MINDNHLNKQGFTLVEVLVSALILVVSIVGIYSAVLWGKHYTRQSQFVVSAAGLGRNEMEEMKAFGIYNADTFHVFSFDTSTTAVIHSRSPSIINPDFDTETKRYSLASDSNVIVFESFIYLHGTPLTDPKFANPIVSYQTQMTVGGI